MNEELAKDLHIAAIDIENRLLKLNQKYGFNLVFTTECENAYTTSNLGISEVSSTRVRIIVKTI